MCLTLLSGVSLAQDSTLSTIRSEIDGGKVRSALRKADQLVVKALALKVTALAKLNRAEDALQAYEVLVSLQRKEDFTLLKAVAWAKLMTIVKGNNDKALQMAAETLGELADKRAVPSLTKLLRSKRFLTRQKAAEALGKIGDNAAAGALKRLLKDTSVLVRISAAWALGKMNDSAGEAFLNSCFRARRGGLKLRCAFMMAKLKKRKVLGYLQRELRVNKNRRARAVIAESLSYFKRNRRWVNLVKRDVKARNEVSRLISVRVLGELKARRGRNALRAALRDRAPNVRIAAAKSLGQIGDRRGTAVLLKSLGSSSWLQRSDAALAFAFVKNRRAKKQLLTALSDKHLLVRINAGHALVQLGSQEGTGVLREGLARGNQALQVMAAKYAILASQKGRLSGQPIERKVGQLAVATITKAFDDSETLPGDDDDSDGFKKSKTASRSKKPGKRPKARRGGRKKPRKRAGGGDDDDDDDW